MANLRLKEVANEATNKDFFNSFFTASRKIFIIGVFFQIISSVTEFHFIFKATGGAYKPTFTLSNILPFVAGAVAIYVFEVIGVRVFLVRTIRQIVNKDFDGNERKVLFVFDLILVLVLCGSNLLLSILGQTYSFQQQTNVTTTDKTHELSNEKSNKVQSINTHFDGLQATLISNYDNDKTSIQSNFDADIKALKNSQSKFKDLEWKYNEYTLKIDKRGEAKTSDLNSLLSQLNLDKEQIRNDRTTQINSVTGTYDNRINDVSKVANSNIDLVLMVQEYTLPLLIIFILLSWVAIVYNEVFLKGAGQTIEIKEEAKKPLLIVVFAIGIYEKIYQMFYWFVAKVIGNKKYEFGDIQQHTIKYEIHQKTPTANGLKVAAGVRQIGFNRNKETGEQSNDSINNSIESLGVSNEVKSDNLTDSKVKNLSNNGERYTVNVPIQQNDTEKAANDRQKRCKNCNEIFNYKHWNAKYCGEKCRIESWELRTGKTFKKKSKK
jgi:uncharacterized membrane protein